MHVRGDSLPLHRRGPREEVGIKKPGTQGQHVEQKAWFPWSTKVPRSFRLHAIDGEDPCMHYATSQALRHNYPSQQIPTRRGLFSQGLFKAAKVMEMTPVQPSIMRPSKPKCVAWSSGRYAAKASKGCVRTLCTTLSVSEFSHTLAHAMRASCVARHQQILLRAMHLATICPLPSEPKQHSTSLLRFDRAMHIRIAPFHLLMATLSTLENVLSSCEQVPAAGL
ncbi:hypothetical protein VNO77_02697 [Canavalia gladiata]|uniref:Uncharacterized protein n=1 Tax=Canavalia gladiata TaxID=3824 RepID=A0AAN9MYG5_CANGL